MLNSKESRMGILSLLVGCVGLGIFVLIALGAVLVLIAYWICADPRQTELFRRNSRSFPMKAQRTRAGCNRGLVASLGTIIAFVADSAILAFRLN
jgi:hypothetical protein